MKIVIILSSILLGLAAISHFYTLSDTDIINRVVQLEGNGHACTGEQIKTPSGALYLLTAAHCRVLESKDGILATTQGGKSIMRHVVAEDPESDLLLLEPIPTMPGLDIAKSSFKRDHIRTFTHGHRMPTYRTDGVVIGNELVMVLLQQNMTAEQEALCASFPKYRVIPDMLGNVCVMTVTETVTNALIVPGSSGGPIVNDAGEIVGVASAKGEYFNDYVTLTDIQRFLRSY